VEETWSTFGHTLTRMLQSYLLIMFITLWNSRWA
jgi:hypothetical protein